MGKFCYTCGGEYDIRYVDKPCPECGRQYKTGSTINVIQEEKSEILTSVEDIKVPAQYVGVLWNKEQLLKDNESNVTDLWFSRYCEQLQKIHDTFMDGRLPNKSGIIIAPPRMSKITWAYSCMQAAITHGFSVNCLLDTVELKRLVVLAGTNPKYKLYNEIDYDSYMMADVCFITVSKTESRYEAYSVILEILDRRSRKGLSTFIISRYDLKQLSKWDYDNNFIKIKDDRGHENDLKYPVIVQYWPFNGKI